MARLPDCHGAVARLIEKTECYEPPFLVEIDFCPALLSNAQFFREAQREAEEVRSFDGDRADRLTALSLVKLNFHTAPFLSFMPF